MGGGGVNRNVGGKFNSEIPLNVNTCKVYEQLCLGPYFQT